MKLPSLNSLVTSTVNCVSPVLNIACKGFTGAIVFMVMGILAALVFAAFAQLIFGVDEVMSSYTFMERNARILSTGMAFGSLLGGVMGSIWGIKKS